MIFLLFISSLYWSSNQKGQQGTDIPKVWLNYRQVSGRSSSLGHPRSPLLHPPQQLFAHQLYAKVVNSFKSMWNEKRTSYQLLQNIKLNTFFPGRTLACSSAVPAMRPATSPATLGSESKVSFSSSPWNSSPEVGACADLVSDSVI